MSYLLADRLRVEGMLDLLLSPVPVFDDSSDREAWRSPRSVIRRQYCL
jgi:hypothetical protein